MTAMKRVTGALSAFAVLVALASVVALTANAGTAQRTRTPPTSVLHAVDGSEAHGAVGFAPAGDNGTVVSLAIHGLAANAWVDAELHAGRDIDHVSESSTPLTRGRASEAGSYRGGGALLSRGHAVHEVDVTDGAHIVLVRAHGRVVAYAHVPRD
jgi:hypothetical protein